MTTYNLDRILPGVALVKGAYPDWETRIDPDTLDMASFSRCVGGQLEGSYVDFATRFELDRHPELATAFNADHPSEAPLLTAVWRTEIRRQRAARLTLRPELLAV